MDSSRRTRIAVIGVALAAIGLVVMAALSSGAPGAALRDASSPPPATILLPTAPPTTAPTLTPVTPTAVAAMSEPQATVTVTTTLLPLVFTGTMQLPTYTYRVVAAYPHDPAAFTQGLQWYAGELYEGTGLYGRSSLRRVELETGAVLQQIDLDALYFGEGIAVVGDRIFQLTWQEQQGFIYDRASFARIGEFSYATEGWGLTYDGQHLLMSDGTATIYRLDPASLAVVDQFEVREGDIPVVRLNELEMVGDELFANIWLTDRIARIDPSSGQITGWIDLTGLLEHSPYPRPGPVDVLNGIAYDAETNRLWVTGKLWPALFEIELMPRP